VVDGGDVPMPPGALSVEFDHVTFAYDADADADADAQAGGAEVVLDDLTWRLEAGQVLGLLGRTGSGKTTISRLLFRLHDVSSGTVRLGAVDVRRARLDDLRSRVALVTQDVQLFGGTLRDNVTLYDPTVGDERLREVFAALGLGRWLDELPDGLDTTLGATARGLSAGETQLVAFARVFLEDPGLVVLDEASSRLDPHTERLLERATSRLLEGRTGIVIAHRITTVQRAEQILILENGRVVELGRRDQLASDPGSRFSRLLPARMGEVLA
jgi:ATP-binding cassette subfamily B protein